MSLLNVPQNEKELILNTPNRNEILKQGPPQQAKRNLLGKGAFGTVFKAIYKGKDVAVKVVKNDVHLNTLLNESNIIGWNHRNIVKIIKIESTPKYGIIIMERFPGYCLQAVLDSSIELSLTHRVFISLDILAAMHYCHKQQILHLDIKPQNILVVTAMPNNDSKKSNIELNTRNYTCKLCDFGASQRFGENKENAAKCSIRGTVRYMAPEALREQPLTPAADIYSLGITMWQLQYKRIPYHWIECNEIVAYQVVKHQLRPNINANYAKSSRPVDSLNVTRHAHCYCNSLSATNVLTYQTVEQLKNLLKTVDFSANLGEEGDVENAIGHERPAVKRKPFQLLGSGNTDSANIGRKSVARHLAFEKPVNRNVVKLNCEYNATVSGPCLPTSSNSVGNTINSINSPSKCMAVDDMQLLQLFPSNLKLAKGRSNNIVYESIYKSCWHGDYHLRPNYTELRMRLGNLL